MVIAKAGIFCFEVVAIAAISGLLTFSDTVCLDRYIPFIETVITQRGDSCFEVVAISAIPGFFPFLYAGAFLGCVPLAQDMFRHRDLTQFIVVAMFTIPAILAKLGATGLLGAIPFAVTVVLIEREFPGIKVRVSVQIYPTCGKTAPVYTVHLGNRKDFNFITGGQLRDRAVIHAGTGANIQKIIGDLHRKTMGQDLIVMEQDLLIQPHPAVFISAPKLIAEHGHFQDGDGIALAERSGLGIGCVGAAIYRHAGSAEDCRFNWDLDLLFHRGAAGALRTRDLIVIRVLQADPALGAITPQSAVLLGQTGDGEFFTPIDVGNNIGRVTGILANADRIASDNHLDTGFGIGGSFRRLRTDFPVGIQGQAVGGFIQRGDLFATLCLCVPAGKDVAFPGRHRKRNGYQIAVVALGAGIVLATVDIIHDIAETTGQGFTVCTVQIHVRLDHSAPEQALHEFAAGRAPLTDGKHEVVTFCAVEHRLDRGAIIVVKHRGAYIVNKGDQRIKLVLIQLDLIADHEGIHFAHKDIHQLSHQRIGFLGRNALRSIALPMLFGTLCSEAYGPLAVVPIGFRRKALHTLDQFHHFIAGGHFCYFSGFGRLIHDQGKKDQCQCHNYRHTYQSL